VAAFDFDGNIFAVFVDGLLGSSNGRGRFETSPDNDIASVADTAQDTSGMVGLLDNMA